MHEGAHRRVAGRICYTSHPAQFVASQYPIFVVFHKLLPRHDHVTLLRHLCASGCSAEAPPTEFAGFLID